MEFCPKCGIILTKKDGKHVCSKCGYAKSNVKISTTEKTDTKKGTAIVGEEHETMPKVHMLCPKCGNEECFFWSLQTRAGDEGETSFYKCVKCKHTWRKYR